MAFVKQITEDPTPPVDSFTAFTAVSDGVICRKPKKLDRLVSQVSDGKEIHYLSDGYFSLHDLVISLVKKYQPVDVFFTTYALRELPVRQLAMCKTDGLINEIHCVLDYKAQVRSAEVNAFAQKNFTTLCLKPIHAKVCVIRSADIDISIVGSANWTVNPKVEAGVLSCTKESAEFHISWIKKMISNERIF